MNLTKEEETKNPGEEMKEATVEILALITVRCPITAQKTIVKDSSMITG